MSENTRVKKVANQKDYRAETDIKTYQGDY